MTRGPLMSIDLAMVVQIINFFILVYVVQKFFIKKIGSILDERKNIALKEFKEIEEEKQKLEEQKNIYEKIRKESKRRANDIIIKAEIQADERKDQIITTATQTREKMLLRAEAEIIKMKSNAKLELQKEVGELATQIAEKILQEKMKDNDIQMKSIDNFIENLGE